MDDAEEYYDEPKAITKALMGDRVILCGYCGHKICEIEGFKRGLGNGTIYLLCQHKSQGKRCKTVNEINL
jgi:hypothetical protein